MKHFTTRLEYWFIGTHLDTAKSQFEIAKAKMLFHMVTATIFILALGIPTFFFILPLIAYLSIFALMMLLCVPFLLKYSNSIKGTTKLFLTVNFIFLATIHLILNNPNIMSVGGWYVVIILLASFILGNKWGLGFTIAPALVIGLLIYFKTIGFSIYDPNFEFDIDANMAVLLTTPIHTFLPFVLIYQVISEYTKAKDAADIQVMGTLEEQCQLYNQLEESENKYRSFIEEADDIIFELNAEGTVVYCNPQSIKSIGFDLSNLVDKKITDLVVEEYRYEVKSFYINQMKSKNPVSYLEMPLQKNNGEVIWFGQKVQWTYNKSGRAIKAFCIARDITLQKETEAALIAAKEEAIKASKAKAQFLSSMSHELRTPMNAVIGMTHLLIGGEPRHDQQENLHTLKFSAENLLNLINDILDFSKIEAGKVDFENIDFALRDVVNSIRHSLLNKCEEKGLYLNLDFDDDIPNLVIGDPVRLAQIINNLISNAIKFTHQGGLDIKVKLLEKKQKNLQIYFEVKDSGIGIPKDKLQSIFENFTQANSSTTRNYGGTGLGLAITKQLLELQKSKIQIESEVDKGSKFFFVLNFEVSSAKTDNSAKPMIGGSINFQSLKGVKVLLVEDNKINQVVAHKFLEKWDIDMDIADNGEIALEKVKENFYHLVLMDLQMPVMNGFDATKAIRKLDGKFKKIPIIALTASAVLDIQDEAMQTGMNDFITKPFEPAQLYSKIRQHASLSIAVD